MIRNPGRVLLITMVLTFSSALSCQSANPGKKSVMVPMRDGIRLATDIYFPANRAGQFPAILVRSLYKKEMFKFYADHFTQNGYVVAVQDVRGCFSSQGEWEPFVYEGQDGYNAVEWLAAQEWSTGKIGMTGHSYDGWAAYCAAAEKPPHLVTIIPCCAPSDMFQDFPYSFGVFCEGGVLWWTKIIETEATADPTGRKMKEANDFFPENKMNILPVIDLDKELFGKEIPYWRTWILHNSYDAYWEQADCLRKLKSCDIPIFLQTGWFDGNKLGAKITFMELKGLNHNVKMTIGPWGHMDKFFPMYQRWFDYWLKNADNGVMTEPSVQLFAVGSNRWLTADTYPLPKTEFTKFYLAAPKDKDSSRHGRLQRERPSSRNGSDSYRYDPADPPPSYVVNEGLKQLGEYVQARKSRKDILVYETTPFKTPTTVAGPLSAKLCASSSAKDTDWCVSLYVLDSNDDFVYSLGFGMLRARFRTSLSHPEYMEKDKIYEFTVDLRHNAFTIPEHCRLVLEISSSFFPWYSRNLNTGGHNEMDADYLVAENRIHRTRDHPSHLILPIVNLSDYE